MIVAGMCAAAVEAADVREVLAAGLAVVPLAGDYAQAVRRGADLGWSGAPVETALEALHAEFGGLQWVHAVNNRALTAFALARSDGDLTAGICTAQTGGSDTDSIAATVGSICGASRVPCFDGVAIDTLAARTFAVAQSGARR
jgi:ADP-ribosylglycohydrolase